MSACVRPSTSVRHNTSRETGGSESKAARGCLRPHGRRTVGGRFLSPLAERPLPGPPPVGAVGLVADSADQVALEPVGRAVASLQGAEHGGERLRHDVVDLRGSSSASASDTAGARGVALEQEVVGLGAAATYPGDELVVRIRQVR